MRALSKKPLAFDHEAIVAAAIDRIGERIDRADIARSLVPRTFTVPELRHVLSIVTGKALDPGNFRRRFQRMLDERVIEPAPGKRITASKPARVYRFVEARGARRTV
jgi:8-oxo-dGTP diphosphatase